MVWNLHLGDEVVVMAVKIAASSTGSEVAVACS
jgi:hypothetical protein